MDGFGGFFTAFMAAKDAGKGKRGRGDETQGEKGSPGEGGGITDEYQQYLIENDLHVNPDGSEGFGRDNRMTGWGGGRGFGR